MVFWSAVQRLMNMREALLYAYIRPHKKGIAVKEKERRKAEEKLMHSVNKAIKIADDLEDQEILNSLFEFKQRFEARKGKEYR